MHRRQLHFVTDDRFPTGRLLAVIEAAVAGGVDVVQVRARGASPEALTVLTRAVGRAVGGRVPVLAGGSVAVALASGAAGVHLPEGHPDLATARQALPPPAWIGASVHSVAAAVAAERAGATSLTFGHVYPTASHRGEPPRGCKALAAVVRAVRLPVIAIGGIRPDRVPAVLATGAAGVAVITAISAAADPRAAAQMLREALDRAREDGGGDGGANDTAGAVRSPC